MTKRALKRMVREGAFDDAPSSTTTPRSAACRSARGWSPLGRVGDDEREQGYLKTIKPKSPGQARADRGDRRPRRWCWRWARPAPARPISPSPRRSKRWRAGKVGRIVLSRPAVEAGESIGFLPGDMEDKLAPYLRPLYDALSDRLSMKRVRALMAEGAIEIAPVGFMRGRTLNNAFVVIDEAQNCTYVQLKMLLTRLGWRSTMVITGDPDQSDLLPELSGLADVAARLEAVANDRGRAPRRRRHRPPPAGGRDAGGAVAFLRRPAVGEKPQSPLWARRWSDLDPLANLASLAARRREPAPGRASQASRSSAGWPSRTGTSRPRPRPRR